MKCDLFTPYSLLDPSVTFTTLRIRAGADRASIFNSQRFRDEDTSLVQQATTSRFTPVQVDVNVPEPSTITLLLTCMVAMGLGHQRKHYR